MNTNQVKGHAHEARGKAREVAGNVTGKKETEYKSMAGKHGGNTDADPVYINRNIVKKKHRLFDESGE